MATVRQDRWRFRDIWPAPAGRRASGGRGRPELEYDAAAVRHAYKVGRPVAVRRAGGPDPARGWDRDEIVDGPTAARRLRVAWNTYRSYPRLYAGTGNPFPAQVPSEHVRWGDVADWKARCPGSGRRGQKATARTSPEVADDGEPAQARPPGRPGRPRMTAA